ncbi:MAG: lamin tail domain-containing protein [Deltaproteobacteria bacterium]|nr:lamin tail domain-containing protein [Deltaproteobacteria bacterium]
MHKLMIGLAVALAACHPFEPTVGTSRLSRAISTTVVISQFRTRGPNGAADEFVEIYNMTDAPIDIEGWKLNASNSSGITGTRATVPSGFFLPAHGYLLFTNSSMSGGPYSGPVVGDLTYATGIVDVGGIALLDIIDTVVDEVGMSSSSAYQEGTILQAQTANIDWSYQRKPANCGAALDTDDNSADFDYVSPSRPHNTSSNPCDAPDDPQCQAATGTCSDGTCVYLPYTDTTTCTHLDPCVLADHCDGAGHCTGTLLVCDDPPGPSCINGDTQSQSYTGPGACVADECYYAPSIADCQFGCDSASGLCNADPCEGVTCDTPDDPQCQAATGACSDGTCSYPPFSATTTCTHLDPCILDDHCDGEGLCSGTLLVCDDPPDPSCINGDTQSQSYTGPGACVAGECQYPSSIVDCSLGCDSATGLCKVDPCDGVTCVTPPDPQCYQTTGNCSDGECSYTPLADNTTCEDSDPCTVGDNCGTDHVCAGSPKDCAVAPICVSATTAHFYLNPRCEGGGQCVSDEVDAVCRRGCDQATGRCAASILIAEFRTRGPQGGNDEFIELYNPTAAEIDVGGWKINGSNASASVSTRIVLPEATHMPARTFLLLANSGTNGYSGAVAADLTFSSGIVDDGGISLLDSLDAVVDEVGMSAGSAYYEGTPLSPRTSSAEQSYRRLQLGCGPDQDTENNGADFEYTTEPTPRNSSSCRLACAGEPCLVPAATCDGDISTAHDVACVDGACVDTPQMTTCTFGCDDATGLCSGDRCIGVTCDSPPNACYQASGTCYRGICSYQPLGTAATCNDGDACTLNDHCDGSGTCSGTDMVCTPPSPICVDANTSRTSSNGVCTDGTCTFTVVDTTCARGCDGATGQCRPDPCAGITCNSPPGACYAQTGTCSNGTCTYPPLAQGASCNDGNACTTDDQCDGSGQCAGSAVVCGDPPNACFAATGNCVSGGCLYDPLPSGTACDDGDACTSGDTCDGSGNCQPGQQTCTAQDGGSGDGPGAIGGGGGCDCAGARPGQQFSPLWSILAVLAIGARRRHGSSSNRAAFVALR